MRELDSSFTGEDDCIQQGRAGGGGVRGVEEGKEKGKKKIEKGEKRKREENEGGGG